MTLTMLSRIAENLFWMGRLIERAEGIARALTVQYFSTLEENINPTWEPILNLSGNWSLSLKFRIWRVRQM